MLDDKELERRLYGVLRQKGLSRRERGAIEMALHYGGGVDGVMAIFRRAGEEVFERGEEVSEKDAGLARITGITGEEPPCVPAINKEVTRRPKTPGRSYPLSF